MTSLYLILFAAGVLACSAVPGLFGSRRSRWGERAAAAAVVLAAAAGLLGALLPQQTPAALQRPWGLPWGQFSVALDPLSRAFLLPVFLVPALGAVYGLGYWPQPEHAGNARKLRLFYGLMPAAMTIVLVARDGALFLIAWEIMAVSAFFLVTTEDDDAAVRRSGWIYFVATRLGTLALLALFAVWRSATGSFGFGPVDAGSSMPAAVANAVFILALIGFGLKAGLMPLHVWLPGAHANAPSHVSAVLSGVMLNLGIYGLIRMTSLLPAPPAWWGATVLAAGAVSAVVGVAFAAGQHDLKRLLAYSSIENIGIIATGIGLALLGRSFGQPAWAVLGLGGAVLHVWNHSLFKPLLFFGAGAVVHGAETRQIDRLGGLGRRMPRTAALFLVGAVAACALPPLNGFVSELLLYLGFFRTLDSGGPAPWPAVMVPLLALAGGLAVVTFTKLFGAVFLGEPRTQAAGGAHEPAAPMLASMGLLALLCAAAGTFAMQTAPLLDGVVASWWSPAANATPPVRSLAALRWLPFLNAALLGLAGVGFWVLRRALRQAAPPPVGTWDCGYAAPGPRMQYTGTSFTQILVSLFAWALWPRTLRSKILVLFPAAAQFHSEVPDPVLDRMVLPFLRVTSDFVSRIRLLQQGQIQVYVLYVLITVVVLFTSM